MEQVRGEDKDVIKVIREQGYKEAEKAEHEQRTGLFRSPLHGIPIGVKDIIAVKDVCMTAGSKVLADYIAPEDATVVEQVRRAGAVFIGKTNTHQFAYGPYTPKTHNPRDPSPHPGRSNVGPAASFA